MNKKIALCIAFASAIAIGAIAVASQNDLAKPTQLVEAGGDYTLTISDMSKIKSDEVLTSSGNKVSFYTNDITSEGVLSDGGYLRNTTEISGITSVTVASEGNIKILGGFYQSGTSSVGFETDTPFATGTGTVVADFSTAKPDYFAIVADGAAATLSSVTIKYECEVANHSFTTYFYSTTQPGEANEVYMIIDSNYATNNGWIDNNAWESTPMTYVGQVGDYYKYSYTTSLKYGLVRFMFVGKNDSDQGLKVCRYDDWKPHSFYIREDSTLYCYCDAGFPADTGHTNTFAVYDRELSVPYKATFNVSFAEGSASNISYVGIKARTGSNDYGYIGSFTNNDGVWSYTYNSGDIQSYDFFIAVYASSLGDGDSEIWKDGSTQTGFNITISDASTIAVVTIDAGVVATKSANITGSVTSYSGCVIA